MQAPQPAPTRLDFRQLVFATALCCLMFEIVLARLVDYHLGAENAYLALPIAFLGLDRFGASAPGDQLLDQLGINVDNVVAAVKRAIRAE